MTHNVKEEPRAKSPESCDGLNHTLPLGLVGPRCVSTVYVGDVRCESILDTGSQVTTISETFHSRHLASLPIKPISHLLEVEGAGGQPVPYQGYVEVLLTFPSSVTGMEEQLTALALIVPECQFNSRIPVLVGTNVLLQLYQCGIDHDRPTFLRRSDSFALLLHHVAQLHENETKTCPVKLHGKKPITVPARHKLCVFGDVRVGEGNPHNSFILEPPESFSLPGGLFLECALMNINCKASSKIPVILRNTTDHSITLPPKCVIGEVSAAQSVKPLNPHQSVPTNSQTPSEELAFNLDDAPMSEEWKRRITVKLNSIPEVFAVDELSFGHTTGVKHHIRLHDQTPFKERSRPIHPSDREAVKQHLRELLDAGIIRESESPFASPVVVVKKKNGKIRLCIDFRKLNNRTIKDAYALPNIEEIFSALSGARWFSVMDLKSGYYQVEMAEVDKHKTAFTCPLGFYEFNRMPQGVTNAPSTFQRLMEKCVGDLHLSEVLVFLDDLIVFSETLEEHEERLMRVLHRLRDYGLKLSPEKCQFFKSSVKYLGHVVDAQGVHTDPDKVSALRDWPRPGNREELKRFLGFSGYYRRFVEGYSKIAKPLNSLTAGYYPPKKRGKVYKRDRPKNFVTPRAPFDAEWTPECESAFRTLIDKLTSAPVLAFADPKLPYVLHTDACCEGLGAALYQEQDEKLRVIAYASRGLSKSERNYPTHKLEYLALKWAICEKFHDFLYGTDFTVLTDNNPLTYVLTSAKLDAAGHRWLAALSTFRFNIKYRAGNANGDADGLSRRPQDAPREDEDFLQEKERISEMTQRILEGEKREIPAAVISAVCQHHSVSSQLPVLAESLAVDASSVPDLFAGQGQTTLPGMTRESWREAQSQDPSINRVVKLVESAQKPSFKTLSDEQPEVKLLLREWNKLELREGILYRRCFDRGDMIHQLVLPEQHKDRALQGLHDEVGHLGAERVLSLARARFYWPRMKESIEKKCQTCERCFRRKAQPQKAAPMVNIRTTYPLELVCMDYLSLEPDSHDTRNILVITDHFTKFAVAVPTKDQKARTVAKALWENFLVHYGFPSRLHSDQGRDFESRTIRELCSLIGAEKVRTTPYHPQGNPVERFNRTLLSMLGTLEEKDKQHWRDFVKPLVHAYNCTRNDTTGYSPYELMFGRQPTLPVDLILGIDNPNETHQTHSEYVQNLRQRLQESYTLAAENSKKTGERNKLRFDAKVRAAELVEGDRVLIRNVNIRGKHKLADKWEKSIHIVVKRIDGGPLYVVKPERGSGPHRTLHRDLLLPCGFLPVEKTPEQGPRLDKAKKMPLRSGKRRDLQTENDTSEGNLTDEEEETYLFEGPPQFATWGPYVQEIESTLQRQPLIPLNPEAPEFSTQHSLTSDRMTSDQSVKPPELLIETSSDVDQPFPQSRDHVVVDIPECDISREEERNRNVSPNRKDNDTTLPNQHHDIVSQELEEDLNVIPESRLSEPRRSHRERHQPHKFTYDELGKPLILAICSLIESLQDILSPVSSNHYQAPSRV